jgi:hypothetical protein
MASLDPTHCWFDTRVSVLLGNNCNEEKTIKFTITFNFFLFFVSVNWVKRCYLSCSLYDMLPEINV